MVNLLTQLVSPNGTRFSPIYWPDLRQRAAPTHPPAVAIRGEGVIETFRELLRRLHRHLDEKHGFAENFGVSEEEFLSSVLSPLRAR